MSTYTDSPHYGIHADNARKIITSILAAESVTGEAKHPRDLGVENWNTDWRADKFRGEDWQARTIIVERRGIKVAVIISFKTGSKDYFGDRSKLTTTLQLRTAAPVRRWSGPGRSNADQTRTYAVKSDPAKELAPESRVNVKGLRKALNALLDYAEKAAVAEHQFQQAEAKAADEQETAAAEVREIMGDPDSFPSEHIRAEKWADCRNAYEHKLGAVTISVRPGGDVVVDMKSLRMDPQAFAKILPGLRLVAEVEG